MVGTFFNQDKPNPVVQESRKLLTAFTTISRYIHVNVEPKDQGGLSISTSFENWKGDSSSPRYNAEE